MLGASASGRAEAFLLLSHDARARYASQVSALSPRRLFGFGLSRDASTHFCLLLQIIALLLSHRHNAQCNKRFSANLKNFNYAPQ
jgi:hypothetical protein